MPVWFENEAPNTTIRSDSFMNQLAIGVPLRPSTPQPSGWSSAMSPFALNVVTTGAPMCSASATIASMSWRAPWPTMISGRSASAMRWAASATTAAGAAERGSPRRPAGPLAGASDGIVCTSSGSTRWATPRSVSACLHASAISSTWSEPAWTVWVEMATSAKARSRSRSWNAPWPFTFEGTWPEMASTGARSTLAS